MTARRKSRNKGKKFPAEPLTRDEVKALLKACSNRAPTGIRNRALIVLFYRCGLRVKEALSLMPKDCDTKQGTIRVLHGKGDKARLDGLDPEAAAVLQRWLDRRVVLGVNGRHPLFCTLHGKPVKSVYVRNLMKRLAAKVGIEKRVHPHGLRHTHAYELANEGTPLHVIQQQLGHSSMATTDRYVRHLNPQAVRGDEGEDVGGVTYPKFEGMYRRFRCHENVPGDENRRVNHGEIPVVHWEFDR